MRVGWCDTGCVHTDGLQGWESRDLPSPQVAAANRAKAANRAAQGRIGPQHSDPTAICLQDVGASPARISQNTHELGSRGSKVAHEEVCERLRALTPV